MQMALSSQLSMSRAHLSLAKNSNMQISLVAGTSLKQNSVCLTSIKSQETYRLNKLYYLSLFKYFSNDL